MKNRLLIWNTSISIIYQIIVVICGFILPRAILACYGSKINGLVNSITQFLSIVSFMELGVGAAISSSLYGPLSMKKWDETSGIVYFADRFFRTLGRILLIYVGILIFCYPALSKNAFGFLFTASLILILSINSFSQYYLGAVDGIILGADQHAFIFYGTQAIVHILNTILCIVFISMGASIHLVKGTTAFLYLMRPLIIRLYVKKKYLIDRKKVPTTKLIKQEWNAAAQHISECILDSTDIMVLTTFSTLVNVSIYSVYHLVVYNLKNVFLIATSSGVLPIMGSLYARESYDELRSFFRRLEWILHSIIVYIFSVTIVLVVPFVQIYTKGVDDANYTQPLFAILICLAHASHCIRLPYFMMVKASGKYKETQNIFIISTILNIIVSIVLVYVLGLPGVAIGTLLAMFLQTVLLARYSYKSLLKIKISAFIRRMVMDAIQIATIVYVASFLKHSCEDYGEWIVLALEVAGVALVILLLTSCVFDFQMFREQMLFLGRKLKNQE